MIPDDQLRDILRRAKTIAVVGLSPKPERPSNSVSRYLQHQGYKIIPINPGHETILGEPTFPSLTVAAEQHPIDIVDVFRNSANAGAVVDEAIPLRPMLIWLQLSVVDVNAEGRARAAGVPFIMDRCIAIEHRHLEV